MNFPICGKEIPEINLKEITVSEWRSLFDNSQPEHDGDKIIAKVSGMTVKEVRDLALYDYRALFKAVLEKSAKPLEDEKNLASAST